MNRSRQFVIRVVTSWSNCSYFNDFHLIVSESYAVCYFMENDNLLLTFIELEEIQTQNKDEIRASALAYTIK